MLTDRPERAYSVDMNDQRLPGMTLKLERVAADVRLKSVAAQMGVSASRLSRIEDDPNLTERMVARYRLALGRCRTFGTSNIEATA